MASEVRRGGTKAQEKLSAAPPAQAPEGLIAEGTVQDVVNRYGAAARDVADLWSDEFTEDDFVNSLYGLSDGPLDRAAAEGFPRCHARCPDG